jgi:hypothetical protein
LLFLKKHGKEPRMANIFSEVVVKSTLSSLLNLINNYNEVAEEMQNSIKNQEWQKVYSLAYEQNTLNTALTGIINNIDKVETSENEEITTLKNSIKTEIKKFKEIQAVNSRLIQDNLYAAKLKTKKVFKNSESESYDKDLKINGNFWKNKPLILNKLA